MCWCESCTIKRAECQRIDAFELWCWRRLLRVLWTARRSNQSILKEISPECSLEGLMLKLKLQYFGHLMWKGDSLASPGRWWRTGKPGVLQFMGLQRAGHYWVTEQQQEIFFIITYHLTQKWKFLSNAPQATLILMHKEAFLRHSVLLTMKSWKQSTCATEKNY